MFGGDMDTWIIKLFFFIKVHVGVFCKSLGIFFFYASGLLNRMTLMAGPCRKLKYQQNSVDPIIGPQILSSLYFSWPTIIGPMLLSLPCLPLGPSIFIVDFTIIGCKPPLFIWTFIRLDPLFVHLDTNKKMDKPTWLYCFNVFHIPSVCQSLC